MSTDAQPDERFEDEVEDGAPESRPEDEDDVPENKSSEKGKGPKPKIIFRPQDILYTEDDKETLEELYFQGNAEETIQQFLQEELAVFTAHHKITVPGRIHEEIVQRAYQLAMDMMVARRFPSYVKARAALRLCLRKVLYFNYQFDFELDGIPKERSRRVGPDNQEQLERNTALVSARNHASQSPEISQKVLTFAGEMLHSRLPVEMFQRKTFENLSPQQLNDLVVNFVFWALEKATTPDETKTPGQKVFHDLHRVSAFLYLFRGLAPEAAQEVFDQFDRPKSSDAEAQPTPKVEKLEAYYHEVEEIFQRDGAVLLAQFLENANFNDLSGRDVRHPVVEPGKYEGPRNSATLHKRTLASIKIPTTDWERSLATSYVVLAQRGNLTARNNILTLLSFLFFGIKREERLDSTNTVQF